MKSLKLLGLSLLALFALGAFAATASAEEGFLVGGNTTPTTATVLGGTSTLGTASSEIVCGELDDSTIKFLNDKHAEGVLHWLKCTVGGLEIHSLGAKEKEILAAVLFLVCLDPLNAKKELVDEFGIEGAVVGTLHLEAPVLGILVLVLGAALGAILTTKGKLFLVEFLGKKGSQIVTDCKEGANLKDHTLLSSTNEGKTWEAASEEVVGGLVTFEKETELMDK